MNKKIIEVEARGPLRDKDFTRILAFLNKNGTAKERKERILIDYSTFLPDQGIEKRDKDIRIRNTNGVSEIIIKTGSWGGNDTRKEHSVMTESNFDTLAQTFGLLGYKKGMLCVRSSHVFEYKNAEIVLVEVPGHSYYFEIDIEVDDEVKVAETRIKLNDLVEELNLTIFSDDEFFAYIETLNKEANVVFNADEEPENYFSKNFDI